MTPLNALSRNHAGSEQKINDNKINKLSFLWEMWRHE
jgi:hypothetical protein